MNVERLTRPLTATVVGTYLLFALGATTATMSGTGPVAWGHYATAAGVWILLAIVTVRAWRDDHPTRVRAGVTAATALYPLQAGIGLARRTGAPAIDLLVDGRTGLLADAHLFGGVVVFGAVLLSLVWHLDADVAAGPTGTDGDRSGPTPSGEPATAAAASTADAAGAADSGEVDAGGPRSTSSSTTDRLRAYLSLTKPRLMWLLCLLALAGVALAAIEGADPDGVTVAATLAGGVLAVGASGTYNHLFERERDRRMDRTSDRPVATETVPPRRAAAFAVGLTAASMAILWTFTTPLATALTAAAIVYYSVVYTLLLKPNTRWNTAIGGGSGALPALIGWAAVAGSVDLPAVALAGVVVLWTPAHFYNLAIVYRDDYANAGYPMLPVVEGVTTTRRRTMYWLGATLVGAVALGVVADLGHLYAVTAVVAGAVFVRSLVRQYERDTDDAAYRSFHASNAYLGLLLAAVVVEAVVVRVAAI